MLFNTRAPDDRLRLDDCRANLFHVTPSRAMKADALAQYLVWKQWRDWFLIRGTLEPDQAFAAAIERAARKFGAKIVETREYEYVATAGAPTAATSRSRPRSRCSPRMRPSTDVVMVADESDIFGEYLPYRTGTRGRWSAPRA